MSQLVSSAPPSAINHQPSNITRFAWRIVDFLIGGLFIYAGVLKVLDPIRFGIDIDSYKIVPWTVAARLAFFLPWLEIFCGAALVTRRLYAGALLILSGLMVVFIGATMSVKVRGLDITCGCFGHLSSKLGFGWHLALDFAILGGLVALWFKKPKGVATG